MSESEVILEMSRMGMPGLDRLAPYYTHAERLFARKISGEKLYMPNQWL